MTCHYVDLGSASDWLKICFNQSEALPRSGHLYGVSMLVPQTLFPWETSGGVAKCRLYSQAFSNTLSSVLHLQFSSTLGGWGGGGLIQYIIGLFLSRDGSAVSEPLSVGKSSLCENERVVISTSNLSNFMRLVNSFN